MFAIIQKIKLAFTPFDTAKKHVASSLSEFDLKMLALQSEGSVYFSQGKIVTEKDAEKITQKALKYDFR